MNTNFDSISAPVLKELGAGELFLASTYPNRLFMRTDHTKPIGGQGFEIMAVVIDSSDSCSGDGAFRPGHTVLMRPDTPVQHVVMKGTIELSFINK